MTKLLHMRAVLICLLAMFIVTHIASASSTFVQLGNDIDGEASHDISVLYGDALRLSYAF